MSYLLCFQHRHILKLNLLTIETANTSHIFILSFHVLHRCIILVVGGRQKDGSVFFEISYYMLNIFLSTFCYGRAFCIT